METIIFILVVIAIAICIAPLVIWHYCKQILNVQEQIFENLNYIINEMNKK